MPKVVDPKALFQDGWDPSSAPPIGPDGQVVASPKMFPVYTPPTLCAQGPCRHYHELTTLANAQGPKDGSLVAYKQIVKTCYPEPGIEMPLNDVPVFSCNRWEPRSVDARTAGDTDRASFQRSYAWERYIADLTAWEALVAQSREPAPAPDLTPTAPDLAGLGLGTLSTDGDITP